MTHKQIDRIGTPGKADRPARPTRRITSRALLEARRLSDPRIHPDGRHIAFVVTEADFVESRWVSHLWITECPFVESEEEGESGATEETPIGARAGVESGVEAKPTEDAVEPDAGESEDPTRQLTFSQAGELRPEWSPDGRYLAFLSARPDESEPASDDDEEPETQIWVLPIEGGEARKITSAPRGVLDYVWLPDSSGLIFLAPEPYPQPVHSMKKERERHKIDPVVEHEERHRRQFWRVDLQERKAKLLFTADPGVQEFALSPDGARLIYSTNYTGEWNDYQVVDLWIAGLESREQFKLVDRRGEKTTLRWSPDGRQVAFLSRLDPGLSYSRESLFVVDVPEASEQRPEPNGPDVSDGQPPPAVGAVRLVTPDDFDWDLAADFRWSRYDSRIYAIAAVHTGTELYAIQDETVAVDVGKPADRSGLDVDPQGTALVWIQQSETALEELYLRDVEGQVHQLTRLNAEFAETYRLPRQEVVSWESRDGFQIEGVLTYPLDYQEGVRCPLIVAVHGGPKGCAQNTLRAYPMPPVWSAEGYAVLQPNYRGSSGYGNAFAVSNRRDLGGGDFADIMAGVDHVIALGVADPQRMGIMGGSYGGYMTNWAIGHTNRFRGAVSMFGIFHLQTDYSNSELSGWDHDYLGAYYWEDPEIYLRLSPGTYIENVRTPTLILHGDEDNNTFISNSKELYQALRQRGVPTQFVHYPREGHGLLEPNHRLDEMRRCLAWMDRYVRHAGDPPGLFRPGDRILVENGLLELCVNRVETAAFVGQQKPPPGGDRTVETATVLLEVGWTLHALDTRVPQTVRTFRLNDLRLEPRPGTQARESDAPEAILPVGVPVEGPGGKVLIEGVDLHTVQHPDPETNQFGFACSAVFRVPKGEGECLLRIGDYPPVALSWQPEEEPDEPAEGAHAVGTQAPVVPDPAPVRRPGRSA